ncbi:hypothetical protein BJX96DRAFT_142342 [Aspergillus floccosus]
MPREGTRGRLRSHEACLNCRRKKTRCPAEKPTCSNCLRLGQQCSYAAVTRSTRGDPSKDRLASLEEKVNLLLNGSRSIQNLHSEQTEGDPGDSHETYSDNHPSTSDPGYSVGDPFAFGIGGGDSFLQPSTASLAKAIDLYFRHCHRQPIWCFERDDLDDPDRLSEELIYSILALTGRFTPEHDQLQHHANTARTLVMLRVANGTVKLETIESLCLLSYSSFIDGDLHLGRFHLGLAFQLCRSAALDQASTYTVEDSLSEEKRRLFWSLQSLEQTYGQQCSFSISQLDNVRPSWTPTSGGRGLQKEIEQSRPPLPSDHLGCSSATDIGIWNLSIHFAWVWNRVRTYISDSAQSKLTEPWRYDSMYTMILSDLTEVENKLSQCHRYDSVKFYERTADDLNINRSYWAPWLKLQFTYHSILTVLNHPFLYIVASQYNTNLAIPNAFWRRSSELVLLHATWIVRMIDMVHEKRMRLIDPFFGQSAAIAATVHLYYCCAADSRLKQKSKTDFVKCRRFLKNFISFSPACAALDQTLDRLIHIASGSTHFDYDWTPCKIHLSVPLMWDILQLNCKPGTHDTSGGSLLHSSLTPSISREDEGEGNPTSTLEIIVATSPEVTVNTADGGQAVHMPPNMPKMSASPPSPGNIVPGDKVVAPADSLMFNTPWLWTDPGQFSDMENMEFQEPDSTIGNIDGFSTWWDFGIL